MEKRKKIGFFLANARKNAGLTQMEASKRLGIHKMTISKWERDVFLPNSEQLFKMSTIYGCDVGSLIGGDSAIASIIEPDIKRIADILIQQPELIAQVTELLDTGILKTQVGAKLIQLARELEDALKNQ